MSLNTIKVPTLEQLGEVAAELGFSFPQADLVAHHDALMPAFEAYNTIDRMPDELPPVTGSHRTPRWRKQSRANSSLPAQLPVLQGKYREFHWFWPQAPESDA